jgi:P2-related tail formation protein
MYPIILIPEIWKGVQRQATAAYSVNKSHNTTGAFQRMLKSLSRLNRINNRVGRTTVRTEFSNPTDVADSKVDDVTSMWLIRMKLRSDHRIGKNTAAAARIQNKVRTANQL